MRLITYNILDGGEGRADPLAEVIQAQNPDIVVLIEADVPAVVERIASRLKMDFILAEGRRHGGEILSRGRILESINHSLLTTEFCDLLLEATVSAAGAEWVIGAVHLHPRAKFEDEAIREKEIDAILRIFANHRAAGTPHLLAGDFNANSPIQQINLDQCKPRTKEEFIANGNTLPRTAVAKLLAAGYVDTLHAVLGTQAAQTGTFTTQHPGQRVDFIFSHGLDPARLKHAKVEQDRLAKYASDHFPVIVEID